MPRVVVQATVSAVSLADLDRCGHGRHAGDPCIGCPGGWSAGNLYLTPGTRIGTTLYGRPIVVPPHEDRHRPAGWEAQ
jgi:hypothetical protein